MHGKFVLILLVAAFVVFILAVRRVNGRWRNAGGSNTSNRRQANRAGARMPTAPLSMSDPRNPNGWTNMTSPNNPNGWTNMNSPNNPNGWRNPNSPNNPSGINNPASPNYFGKKR